MQEYEIQFLDINVPEIEAKLKAIGARQVGEQNFTTAFFDYPDLRLDKNHSWIRLRTDGKETTLAYKERLGVKSNDTSIPDEGMKEIEVVVGDYKKMHELFCSMGFIIKREMEKRRIKYTKGVTTFDIDFWPRLYPILEVESDSLENAKASGAELGLNRDECVICSPSSIYVKNGINPNDYRVMTFKEFIKK